jgi:drug/metabolite transporter (DMT)-like permease
MWSASWQRLKQAWGKRKTGKGIERKNAMTQGRYTWVIFALFSAASFASLATCVRIASGELPQSEVVFFRNFIGLLLLVPFAIRQKLSLRTNHLRLHLFRAGAGITAMYLYFYAIVHLPLTDAVLLNYTSPLFVSLFAVIWLKEELSRNRKLSGILGLVGVLCLFHPSSASASLAGLSGLLSGLMTGLALTSVKRLSNTEPGLRIVIMFALLASIYTAIPMLWEFTLPSGTIWIWLIAIGGFGNLGQLSLAYAYKLAPASQVSPLGYSGLLFAGLIGFFLWQETPDYWMGVGTCIIVIAGILVARERIEPMPAPPSSTPHFHTT